MSLGRFKGRQVSNKLSPQELLDLLKSKDHGQFSGIGDDNVITDECLDKLLDRSFFSSDKASGVTSSQSEDNEIFKVVENEKSYALFWEPTNGSMFSKIKSILLIAM